MNNSDLASNTSPGGFAPADRTAGSGRTPYSGREEPMSEQYKGIPEGASAVIPRLICRDPGAEIEFVKAAFGAQERVRRPGADGKVAHAMMLFGPAMVMIESEWPEATNRAPAMDGSSPVALYIYI